jgi:hypothetical protein
MIKEITKYILILTLLIIITPIISLAQDFPTASLLELSLVPENPEPGQLVKLSVASYTYDLDHSKITWLVDGVEKKTQFGLRDFNTNAGRNGQKTTIKVVVETPDGPKEIEVFFIPSVVDLIYESMSYTPPFYKGRALNPNQGVVIVTALPQLIKDSGEKIPAQNIVYSWKKDGQVMQADSGVGKNSFILFGTIPIRDIIVAVSASSLDGNTIASKQINITNVSPKILFYEDSPIYGIMFNKAISGTVRMFTDEFKVKSFPYFMTVGYSQSPDLKYTWDINGSTSENLDIDKGAMIFRQISAGAGAATVGLKIENTDRIFQFVSNNFIINFQKQ